MSALTKHIAVCGAVVFSVLFWCCGQERALVVGDGLPSPLPVTGKKIAMLFDDGPLPANTAAILDGLKKCGMRATFSVVGKNVEANRELTRRIVAEGSELANQTWSHPDFSAMSREQILEEVRHAEAVIFETTGAHTRFFRPPAGKLTDDVSDMLKAEGYLILMPTFDSGDWRSPPPGTVRKTILDGVTPGAIILAHDSFPKSVGEMPGILEELAKRGFQSYTVSELTKEAAPQN